MYDIHFDAIKVIVVCFFTSLQLHNDLSFPCTFHISNLLKEYQNRNMQFRSAFRILSQLSSITSFSQSSILIVECVFISICNNWEVNQVSNNAVFPNFHNHTAPCLLFIFWLCTQKQRMTSLLVQKGCWLAVIALWL